MKTLKESLLDDIGTTLKNGNKMIKNFAAAEVDIKYIYDRINDFDSHSASPSKWYICKDDNRTHTTIFFKTPKLTKYFNLPGKHIFIQIIFDNYFKTWGVNVIFSNANKTTIDNKRHQMEHIGSIRGHVLHSFEEQGIPNNKASKFRIDEFIKTYVSPMFNSIESFKQYVVDPYEKGIRPNTTII